MVFDAADPVAVTDADLRNSAIVALSIGGSRRPAGDGGTFERTGPDSGAPGSVASAATVQDAVAAADAAGIAFDGWAATGPSTRRAALNRAADALERRTDKFIDAMARETGSTEAWARFNVMLAASMIREAAALVTRITGQVIPSDKPGCLALALREPAGVVLGIAPWNAPVILAARAIAVPLACGNTVVLKGSETCPWTHALVAEAFDEAQLGPGVVNFIINRPEDAGEVVGALIDHAAVRRINFTGSTSVGRIVAARAARHPKPVVLELGGKAPLLVLDDANIDEAVAAAAFGAFMNQGQICMSTERIIVVEAVFDTFVERFAAKAATLHAGDPRNNVAPLGAMIGSKAADHVRDLITDAVAQGARVVAGGPGAGVYIPATVLAEVTSEMRLYAEESFGPLVAILRARDENDAIRIANDSDYGLSASVFTRDTARGLRVARRIRSGICHVNGPTVHDEPQMPFGGVGASGLGRFGGDAGIDSFTELRWITVHTRPGHFPL